MSSPKSGRVAREVRQRVAAGAALFLVCYLASRSGYLAPDDSALSDGHALPAYVLPAGSAQIMNSQRRQAILGSTAALTSQQLLGVSAANAAPPVGGPVVTLNNGLKFPKASFGLQVYDDDTAQKLTETAISVGYRNFFASVLAGNQKGFARGVAASGVPREELFICGTVLSNRAKGFRKAYQSTKQGCDENLKAFAEGGIKYVDMIMLDYPGPDCDSIKGQWAAFEDMLAEGTTKSIAVSNFSPLQLDCILSNKSATVPAVNQLEYSVRQYDPNDVMENQKRGIVVQAWSPLGGGRLPRTLKKVCGEIGKQYGKSAYQVALRWIVETGVTYSTQTRNKDHFIEDLDIFDFELTEEDKANIVQVR